MQSFSIAGWFSYSSKSTVTLSTFKNCDLSYVVFQAISEYVKQHSSQHRFFRNKKRTNKGFVKPITSLFFM